MDRHIRAPEQEWLTEDQAAAWLGVSAYAFRKLVEQKTIPPGRKFGPRIKMWAWRTIVAVSWLMESGFLVAPDDTVEE